MGTISLIIRREYLTRVRKKTFIIMTILGPVLMASLFIVPIIMAKYSETEESKPFLFDILVKFFISVAFC
jgi:ABC-2 type transport system permease protein